MDISQKSFSLSVYSVSSRFGVLYEKLPLSTSENINDPCFEVVFKILG